VGELDEREAAVGVGVVDAALDLDEHVRHAGASERPNRPHHGGGGGVDGSQFSVVGTANHEARDTDHHGSEHHPGSGEAAVFLQVTHGAAF